MKTIRLKHLTLSAAVAVATLVGLGKVQAQTYIATFDSSITANDGTGGNCAPLATTAWDGAVNAPSGPAGGSEYVTIPFGSQTGWQEMQLNFTGDRNLANMLNVELDIKVDAAHSTLSGGRYGALYPVIQNWSGGSPGWGQLSGQDITNNGTGWQHMKFQLVGVASSLNRLVLDFNSGGAVTNSYWIDNVALTSAPLPLPTMNVPVATPKTKGLTFLPATTGQYQRVMVYPNVASPQYGWYGQATGGNPVSYSFTITNFPALGSYTAQMFFIPINAMQYNQADTSVDWNCTNDMVLTISGSNNDGPATNWTCTLATKTNSPGALGSGNPNLTITNFSTTTLPLGTWTITFNNNTDFIITAPDNSQVNASLPADVADLVSGNSLGSTQMAPYFGIQNNRLQNNGLPAVMSNIKITGAVSPNINDSFTAPLNTNTWSILSDEPQDVYVNTGDLIYYVSWNTPNDNGYSSLLVAPTAAGPWSDLVSSAGWMMVNGSKAAQVTTSGLQAATGQTKTALFRLVKRTFTQLQILLPGQTNAPGTLLGYVGNPISQSVNGSGTDITVNACDSTWHIVNAGDMIRLSSSDINASLPADRAMANGTVSFTGGNNLLFGTQGTWTVTATDLDDPTKAPATSDPVIVGP
ncbi:MAG: hypothetical protein WDM80_14280 [Limisphaerales bacterium]